VTNDEEQKKVVISFSSEYVTVSLQTADSTELDQEKFRYPASLDEEYVEEEAKDCFNVLYDYCNSIINSYITEPDNDEYL